MASISELEKKVDNLAMEVAMLHARLDTEDVYVLSNEERKEIQKGLQEVEAGDLATDEEVAAVYKKFGI